MKKSPLPKLLYGLGLLCFLLLSSKCKESSDPCGDTTSTYNSNMKAIIDNKCVSCHNPSGSAATVGDYTSYNGIKPKFTDDKLWKEIEAGRMPKTGSLTSAEKNAFECWKDAGYPEN